MIFNSFKEMESYIKNKHKQTIKVIAEKEQRILRDEVMKQVYESYTPQVFYERTWSLYNNIKYYINGNQVTLILEDNGNWHSVYNESKLVYAFATLEAGTTWGRGGTNIEETVIEKNKREIPKVYKSTMNSLGVPVR